MLVIGEALIDIVERPDGGGAEEHLGGSPANVALGLARLDVPVRLRTALADDERGTRIRGHLESSGAQLDPASSILARTSTAKASIAADGSAQYHFDLTWELPGEIDLGTAEVVHTGSIAAFLEPGGRALLDFLRAVHRRARITFDPNIRPALVGEHEAAVRRAEAIASLAEVVKLSDEDAAWLYPALSIREVIDRLLSLGVTIVAVTCGADGAVLARVGELIDVVTPTVDVRDTVGAGDTFMAALIDRMLDPTGLASLEDLGRYATTAAAMTVARRGADLPVRSELDTAIRARRGAWE
nr:PfkB family carbohydrate kinase [Microbacterium bovistercoris]